MNSIIEDDIRTIIDRILYQEIEGKTFLITGANGFLASAIVNVLMYLNAHYLDRKCKVLALCRNREKAEDRFDEYLQHDSFKLYIQSVEEVSLIDEKPDYIIHAASSAVTSDHRANPVGVFMANVIGTQRLLELAHHNQSAGFLFFSSGAAYGEVPENYDYIIEKDYFPLNFLLTDNCYAEAKRSGEALCQAYWKQYGVPAKIVRIGHTYGPNIDLKDGRVFSDFVNKICKHKDLVIKGSGDDVRPFCYISDAVVAFFLILLHGENGEVYNMVNNQETVTIKELAEILVYKAFPERNLKVKGKDLVQGVCGSKVIVNTDKLIGLGWHPDVDIVEGFRRTVKSFEEL